MRLIMATCLSPLKTRERFLVAPDQNQLNELIRELELIYSMKELAPMSGPSEGNYSTESLSAEANFDQKHATAKAELPA
jgi:hypothetical protein